MRASLIIGVVVLVALGALACYSARPVWQYCRLEQNAKKVVTGTELQAWATNLLAQYPSNVTLKASLLGTNFPQRLRSLAPEIGPSVRLNFPDNTNFAGWVMVGWGSGMLGSSGFEVGPTNYAYAFRSARAHEWQPGVYFFRR